MTTADELLADIHAAAEVVTILAAAESGTMRGESLALAARAAELQAETVTSLRWLPAWIRRRWLRKLLGHLVRMLVLLGGPTGEMSRDEIRGGQ